MASQTRTRAVDRVAEGVGAACENCGAALVGPYCHVCGQSRASPMVSLGAFVRHVLSDLVGLETRTFRTVRALLFQPGELSRSYLAGQRVRYAQPLQVYLASAATFFLVSAYHPVIEYRAQARELFGRVGMSDLSARIPPDRLAALSAGGRDAAAIQDLVQKAVGSLLPGFLATSLVLFTAVVSLLYLRSRMRVLEHVVFTLHWAAVYLLAAAAIKVLDYQRWGDPFKFLLLLGTIPYLAVALRRTYGGSWVGTLLRTPLLWVAFLAAQMIWIACALRLAIHLL